MERNRARSLLLVAGAFLTPVGGLVEQIIHLPYGPNMRYVFGTDIGNYWGNFMLGVILQSANMLVLATSRQLGVPEKRVYQLSAALMGVGLGLLIGIENFRMIGTPQLEDTIPAVLGCLSLACSVDLHATTKPISNKKSN